MLNPSPAPAPDRLITVAQVVRQLGITRSLAYRMIRDGRLPAIRLGKRTVRVKASTIAKLLAQAG